MTYPWLEEAETRLEGIARGERQAHALLLSGPRGLGKFELALREAVALLCLKRARPGCGACRSCQLMEGGAHPDFRLVTFEDNDKGQRRKEIVVGQIRDLIASLQLTHSLSARKLAVIHPAEAMNRNAANALLKTLEEPAGDVVLLMVSSDDARLPATVRSRCQTIAIRLPDVQQARAWLIEATGADADAAALALEAGAGSPLAAAEMLDSGLIDEYRRIRAALEQIERNADATEAAFAGLSDLDPQQCWSWLSLASAGCARRSFTGQAGDGPDDPTGRERSATVLRLHAQANRNFRLMGTPVRHDLLLRDWLLQWAATAPKD